MSNNSEFLTNRNSSWEEWYKALKAHASSRGGSAAHAESWREGYEMGRTPAEEWFDAWGEL